MRKLIFFLLIAHSSFATNYYVSNTGNDANTGTSAAFPWQTLSKVSSVALNPGDNVFFLRGNTFYGTLTAIRSGTSSNHITYSSYGLGSDPNPIITGFTTATGWTSYGGGIYYIANSYSSTILTVNGNVKYFGRYPNSGNYLYCSSYSGKTSITTASTLPTNFTGSQIVMKTANWVIGTYPITGQSGNTTTYTGTAPVRGSTDSYTPATGTWYFFQNSIACLDTMWEWCQVSGNLYIYSGGSAPTATVQYSTQNYNIDLQANDYIDIYNIDLQGASLQGINGNNGATNNTFNGINFKNQGGYAFNRWLSYSTFTNCTVLNALAGGIKITGSNIIVSGCTTDSTGMSPGNQYSGDGTGIAGVSITGGNSHIYNNNITHSAYVGIDFNGSNVVVEHNFVNYYGYFNSDGGGIYFSNPANIDDTVRYNVVGNGLIPFFDPTANVKMGIYCDNGARDGAIIGNTVFNCIGPGLYNQVDAYRWFIDSNTLYNNGFNARFNGRTQDSSKMNTFTHNIMMTTNPANFNLSAVHGSRATQLDSMFRLIDYNYYMTVNQNALIQTDSLSFWRVTNTLPQWQLRVGQDNNSHLAPKIISSADSVMFVYNATQSPTTTSLPANYIDARGASYNGNITLQPYTSAILIHSSALNPVRIQFLRTPWKTIYTNIN